MTRCLCVGLDEAGYGPNLGPLLLASAGCIGPTHLLDPAVGDPWTLWKPCFLKVDQFSKTAPHKARSPNANSTNDSPGPLVVDDSKQVLKMRDGLTQLARTLSTLYNNDTNLAHPPGQDFLTDLARFFPQDHAESAFEPWLQSPVASPVEFSPNDHDQSLFQNVLKTHDITWLGFEGRLIQPRRFNTLLEQYNNKAEVHLQLMRGLLRQWFRKADASVPHFVAYVDRMGGRRFYLQMVQDALEPAFVWIIEETRFCSAYQFELNDQGVTRTGRVEFRVQGEQASPLVALASMHAKFFREWAMRHWNAFFQQHDPSLRPTAGYPQDAKRFVQQAKPVLKKLKWKKNNYWRLK